MLLFPKQTALIAGLMLAAVAASAGTALITRSADAQSPPLGTRPYALNCWQDGVQIVSVREDKALQSLSQAVEKGITLENADGSRRVLAPLGDSLCVLEFTAWKN